MQNVSVLKYSFDNGYFDTEPWGWSGIINIYVKTNALSKFSWIDTTANIYLPYNLSDYNLYVSVEDLAIGGVGMENRYYFSILKDQPNGLSHGVCFSDVYNFLSTTTNTMGNPAKKIYFKNGSILFDNLVSAKINNTTPVLNAAETTPVSVPTDYVNIVGLTIDSDLYLCDGSLIEKSKVPVLSKYLLPHATNTSLCYLPAIDVMDTNQPQKLPPSGSGQVRTFIRGV
jgi:hypothetical protein